jgi:hypothetical protein
VEERNTQAPFVFSVTSREEVMSEEKGTNCLTGDRLNMY